MGKRKQEPAIGDNSGEVTVSELSEFDANQLSLFVNRIENLEAEKKALTEDIGEVYKEAKGRGLDPKIIRKVVAHRRMDANRRAEQEALIDLYLGALGQLSDTPLGNAAVSRAFA